MYIQLGCNVCCKMSTAFRAVYCTVLFIHFRVSHDMYCTIRSQNKKSIRTVHNNVAVIIINDGKDNIVVAFTICFRF